jgi:hypothetical protein
MSRYIDADRLLAGIYSDNPKDVMLYIATFPAADVAEVRRGRWEELMEHRGAGGILGGKDICVWYACSECGEQSDIMTYCCPNCGARMDGEEE